MLKIKFETDNAAFEDKGNETAWILKRIADKVEAGSMSGPVMDSNGNKIGFFELT